MTRLAAWIMASPINALLVTLLLGFTAVFSWAAAVPAALITLRKGVASATLPLAGLIGMAVYHWVESELTLAGTAAATLIGALVLGTMRSLPAMLVATAAAAAVYTGAVQMVGGPQLSQLSEQYRQMMSSLDQSGGALPSFSQALLLQLIGIWVTLSAMASLFIARSMQARLFNPGGFRQEFHGMRLTPALSALCVAPLLIVQLWPDIEPMAGLFLMPVLMAGLALVHGIVARKSMGAAPLVVLYMGLFLFAPVVTPLLLMAAMADSFFDFRQKMA